MKNLFKFPAQSKFSKREFEFEFFIEMKCSKVFWKNQLNICIATTVPFIGLTILEILFENRIQASYKDLIKPKWGAEKFWVC